MFSKSDDSLRDKYKTLLSELESKESFWTELDQSIRRTLASLLIIAKGPASKEITKGLDNIRDELRKGAPIKTIEAEVEELKRKLMSEGPLVDKAATLPPVHEILIEVIEHIPLSQDLSQKAAEIIKNLAGGISRELLPWAINSIGTLVLIMRTRLEEEKKLLENLLQEVSERLKSMEISVISTHDVALQGYDSTRALDKKVRAEVKGIQDSADKATDFSDFRETLNSALKNIQDHMSAKLEEDRQKEALLTVEVEKLKSNVVQLEQEVEMERTKLRQARENSQKDPLTGCLNRLAYEERINLEYNRSSRYGTALSIVVFDIDRFKLINDNFGHAAGDQVLKAVAQIANSQIREVDAFCRYGGEEFVAILPETDIEGAKAVAEKVRKSVEDFHFHSRGKRVLITTSAGMAMLKKDEPMESLFERADEALYRAKESGRNRCLAG